MRLRKLCRRRWIVPQMNIEIIAPAVGGGDLNNSTVDRPPADRFWLHRDDAALPYCIDRFGDTDVYIMAKTVGGIDDEVMAVVEFVGQASFNDPSHDLARGRGFWIVNRILDRRPLQALLCKRPVYGLDDIPA